jgi:hypothetical protein
MYATDSRGRRIIRASSNDCRYCVGGDAKRASIASIAPRARSLDVGDEPAARLKDLGLTEADQRELVSVLALATSPHISSFTVSGLLMSRRVRAVWAVGYLHTHAFFFKSYPRPPLSRFSLFIHTQLINLSRKALSILEQTNIPPFITTSTAFFRPTTMLGLPNFRISSKSVKT